MSPLQQRLDHLVNYSSQLIFVSGETIAEQQRHLEQFLVQQHDDTEVSFIQLDEESTDVDIRHRIACQLIQIDQKAVTRPINEVLHQLNNFDGPILICITQAQFMSASLLNELWDLVLQSRFANNKQHLNVILFAESKWAKRAQEVLPARNTNQPLLFSSDTFDARPARDSLVNHPDNTDLVEADRYKQYRQTKRVNHILLALVIVLCAALGVSLYAHVDSALIAQLSDLPEPASQSINNDVARSTPSPELLKPAISNETQAMKERLAGYWHPQLTDKANKEVEAQDTVSLPINSPMTAPSAEVQSGSATSSLMDVTPDMAKQDVTPPTIQNMPQPAAEEPAELAPEILAMYDNASMLALDDDAWVLQLVGMTSIVKLEQFITDFALEDQSWIYYTERFGGDWFVLVLNNSFTSRQDALSRVNSLPPEIIASAPFAKTVRRVKDELRTLNEAQ